MFRQRHRQRKFIRWLAIPLLLAAPTASPYAALAISDATNQQGVQRYFPPHLLHAQWQEFPVRGYRRPIPGVVYRGLPRPTCGLPLGGLDTGALDFEPTGMLGYCTLFNHFSAPRLLYNEPWAAIHVDGQTELLATDVRGKEARPVERVTGVFPPTDYTPSYFDTGLRNVRLARSIDYFGHYPVVDAEFDLNSPVAVGMRAWSPMLPGDAVRSMMPGIVWEFDLRNTSNVEKSGVLAVNFPGLGPVPQPLTISTAAWRDGSVGLQGIRVATSAQETPAHMEYVLAVVGKERVRTGGGLGVDGAAWNQIDKTLPPPDAEKGSSSLAIDFRLGPKESVVVRLVLAWHAPLWNAGGAPNAPPGRAFRHMYARHYSAAASTAIQLATEREKLWERVVAWQEAVYDDPHLPGWLADSLVNNLHLIAETSIWGQSEGPLAVFPKAGGLFALNECPRGCPQLECIPCSFYGNMPIAYFYPEAALSTLRGYKQYQFPDGRPPWIFGGITAGEEKNRAPYDMAAPDKGYQSVLNGASYLVMADRYWRMTGDDDMLKEFYPSLKRANDFSMSLRPKYGLSQVMAMPEPGTDAGGLGDTEWFEAPEPGWKGYVTHAGGVRMAQIQIMRRMAEAMGDDAYAKKCDAWLEAGNKVLEEKLWNQTYYLNFFDPDNNLKSDLIFGYQLDGQWVCRSHGVPGVFPQERVAATLATLRQANCALSQTGATNYANPDGSPAKVGGYGTYGYFPPELMMLAMTYMYEGEAEFGTDLLYRCLENIVCRWGYTWDFPNTIRGDMDTGQRHFGADYYQNMMLWLVPAALSGEDLTGVAKPGRLVDRVRRAAKGS